MLRITVLDVGIGAGERDDGGIEVDGAESAGAAGRDLAAGINRRCLIT